ncbi:MAG: hypothetical protein AAGB46_09125 [Verrucomicrobiota bacterium]
MSPETFAQELQHLLGSELVAVVLYGSAAAGERSEAYSDYNVMVVCRKLGIDELDLLSPLTSEWSSYGNPPPLLFTWDRLLQSADVFPIELLDIKETHRMLHGEDVLRSLSISQGNLRFQLEHELKGKLIQLRESYLLTGGRTKDVTDLMIQSLSAFQVLLRATLRFYEVRVPPRKRDAVALLEKHLLFDLSVFREMQDVKDGSKVLMNGECVAMFKRYLETVEQVADLLNQLDRRRR